MVLFGLNSFKSIRAAQKTERETKKFSKNAYNTWKGVIKNFGMDFIVFLEENEEKIGEYENSLVFMEMYAFTKRLANVQNLVSWGFYHSALVELRFMLETTILAFYLDTQLPNTGHSEKIKLMQKHKGELWGNRLRRRSYMYDKQFGEEVEKVIQAINVSIDEYMADNSVEIWKEKNLPFSARDFDECVFHSKNATALIVKHFLKSFEKFKYNGSLIITLKEEKQAEKPVETPVETPEETPAETTPEV
ncbi:MAG: hypothetical protein KGD59_13680 [Candidatus Heimdallarchaeota archaeon]|nr:hypothetical protein [Candidatus Heimdallarchaeota archaeon]MBY8995595.1 hypothetical protein [Candidatus Heimdallarchaeota archaeon]